MKVNANQRVEYFHTCILIHLDQSLRLKFKAVKNELTSQIYAK